MAVQVHLTAFIQKLFEGSSIVTAEGSTVGSILDDLDQRHPCFKDHVLSEDGKVHSFLHIFLNDDDIGDLNDLDTPINEGDQIYIVPAMGGG